VAKKYALLVGTDRYEDRGFSPLTVPRADVAALKNVLTDPQIGGFDQVDTLLNGSLAEIMEAVGELFGDKSKDDLLLLYFSGHGALDRSGELHLSVAQTKLKRLSTTALSSTLIKNEMNHSRSRRQVLILDCCYAGAFSRNSAKSKSATAEPAVTEATFDVKGYGREILVSSSATQRSWEGDEIIGNSDKSLFTHFLVQGLAAGEAAPQGGSDITVGQLYDYVHDKVVAASPAVTPQRWAEAQTDSIVLAQNPKPVVKTTPLPEDILRDLDDDRPHVREGAIRELGRLAAGEDQKRTEAVIEVLRNRRVVERDIYVHEAIDAVLSKLEASANDVVGVEQKDAISAEESAGRHRTQVYLFISFLLIGVIVVFWKSITTDSPPDIAPSVVTNPSAGVRTTKAPLEVSPTLVESSKPVVSAKRKPGTVFQDTLNDGSKGPEMVVIPAGSFRMGDIQGVGHSDEQPVHKVTIKRPFALSKYPITFAEYDHYREAINKPKPSDNDWGRGNRPVINVSWIDATAYAAWLSDQTGKRYRLPSEAEWEYAARGWKETEYWWGDEADKKHANFSGYNTTPVDKYAANPFGLHDTSGNVWEWVQDTWHDTYKSAPIDGSAWFDSDSRLRVLRGGSWGIEPDFARSAYRYRYRPETSSYYVGFRLAQDL